jgi:glutamyl-Q tRNA(Asp) synthetase
LHAGSLAAALASWLDARAHGGTWLVRIEDVDTPRCIAGMDHYILGQMARCGLIPDATPLVQSLRLAAYGTALQQLIVTKQAYACACTRKDIEIALTRLGHAPTRHAELLYPGTCRQGLNGRGARSWRFLTRDIPVFWKDRRLGEQQQNVALEVGDFVIKRADGLFAYQLSVVVDDAMQGISHIVRGEDLTDNTARQIALQQALGLPTPRYLHTPLVLAADGQKLSKQNGAAEVDTGTEAAALGSLFKAAAALGLDAPVSGDNTGLALARWTHQWRSLYTTP